MLYQLQVKSLRPPRKIPGRLLDSLPVVATLVVMIAWCIPALGQAKVSSSPQPNLNRLQWNKQPGVQRYRLKIARDERFNDVLFDGVVSGQEYVVTDLLPGRYYWRLTSLDRGKPRVLRTTPFEVRPDLTEKRPRVAIAPMPPANRQPIRSAFPDWLAATGEISTPLATQLRSGSTPDIIGVNPHGTVYAIDPTNGVALWIARSIRNRNAGSKDNAGVQQPAFQPVVMNANSTQVVVSYHGGVRALDGSTGREAWARELPGHFVGGLAADVDSRPGAEIYISDSKLNQLISLDATTGAVLSQRKLTEKPTGPPLLLQKNNSIEILVPLDDAIELRSVDGKHLHTIKAGATLTTAPVVVSTARGKLILVGTRSGLAAFDADGFAPLGRIVLDGGDYPIGALSRSDGPGLVDTLIMISDLGRVVAVNLAEGKVKWIAEGFTRAFAAAFADIDSDGQLDILVPGVSSFATALSAGDGSLIWQSDEHGRAAPQAILLPRATRLTSVTLKDGRIVVVGNDVSGIGLRALQVTGGVAGAARN